MKILDLETGTEYLAFPYAEKYSNAEVTGLDIVQKALEENCKKADGKGVRNIRFVSYDRVKYPFPNGSFEIVMTQYTLHHFPEISTMLKSNGIFFICPGAK